MCPGSAGPKTPEHALIGVTSFAAYDSVFLLSPPDAPNIYEISVKLVTGGIHTVWYYT